MRAPAPTDLAGGDGAREADREDTGARDNADTAPGGSGAGGNRGSQRRERQPAHGHRLEHALGRPDQL